MKLKHVALVSTSEKKAEKFYGKLLGLKKWQPKYLPPSLLTKDILRTKTTRITRYKKRINTK